LMVCCSFGGKLRLKFKHIVILSKCLKFSITVGK
jgi:hypothetical protein